MSQTLPVFLRRHSSLFPEKRAETRRIGESELVGYLGDGHVCAVEQRHCFARDCLEHQLLDGVSAHRLGQFGEILGRKK